VNIPLAVAAVTPTFRTVGEVLRTIATTIGQAVMPILISLGQWIQQNWQIVAAGLVAGLVAAAIAFQVLSAAIAPVAAEVTMAMAPVYAIGIAVAALAGGLIYAYQNFDTFRAVVDAVGSWLKGTLWPLMQTVFTGIVTVIGAVVSYVVDHWPQIQAVMQAVWDAARAAWEGIGKPIFDMAVATAQGVINFFVAAWPVVAAAFADVFRVMREAWDSVGAPIFGFITGAAAYTIGWFKTTWSGLSDAFGAVWGVMQAAWDSTGGKVFKAVEDAINRVIGPAKDLIGYLQNIASLGGLGNTLGGMKDDLTAQAKAKAAAAGVSFPMGKAKAAGGPVFAGVTYPVGELGMELFTPASDGFITPHHAIGMGGGGTVEIHNHFHGPIIGTGLEAAARELSAPLIKEFALYDKRNNTTIVTPA
jgi:hypothetical protein